MAIEYKNSIKAVTSTGSDQTIYTCPTTTSLIKYSAIVKTFTVFNTTGGAGTLDAKIVDTSAGVAAVTFNHFPTSAYTTLTAVNAVEDGPLILESGDILKIDTSVQPANVVISVMEISDELRGV